MLNKKPNRRLTYVYKLQQHKIKNTKKKEKIRKNMLIIVHFSFKTS